MPAGYEEEERRRRREEGAAQTSEWEHAYPQGEPANISDFDRSIEGVPIIDWLLGGEDRRAAARDEAERAEASLLWRSLLRRAPTAEDLTPNYYLEAGADEFGSLAGGASQLEGLGQGGSGDQHVALAALRQLYESGGYTDADAAARRLSAMERGQQLRGVNEATLQQMQARGMGGSGAELAARLSASQTLSQGQAMSDAAMQQAAMQRALAALQGYGGMATDMRSQEMGRRSAIDAWNQANMGWRRDRETRNTSTANRQQDSRVAARQAAYQNQERGIQGLTNRFPGGNRQGDDHSDERGLLAGLGEILDL